MNKERIKELKEDIISLFDKELDMNKLNELKVEYLGKTGVITELSKGMKDVPNEEKKEYGMLINELRELFNEKYETKKKSLEELELNKKLASEEIDVTLPGTIIKNGAPNILEHIIEEVEEVFMSMGYDVVDGPEIEEDKYNFELLIFLKDIRLEMLKILSILKMKIFFYVAKHHQFKLEQCLLLAVKHQSV